MDKWNTPGFWDLTNTIQSQEQGLTSISAYLNNWKHFTQSTHWACSWMCCNRTSLQKLQKQMLTSKNHSRASNDEELQVTTLDALFDPWVQNKKRRNTFSFPMLIPKASPHMTTDYYFCRVNHELPFKRHVLFAENRKNWPECLPHSQAQTRILFPKLQATALCVSALHRLLIGPKRWLKQSAGKEPPYLSAPKQFLKGKKPPVVNYENEHLSNTVIIMIRITFYSCL